MTKPFLILSSNPILYTLEEIYAIMFSANVKFLSKFEKL